MEETSNMTAERSLEIITEQIAQSRKAVSKDVGQSLYVSGLCTMGIAALITLVILVFKSTLGHLLWLLLPLIIHFAIRNKYKEPAHAPASIVGRLVGKTWSTFAVFVSAFFIISIIWGFIACRLVKPDVYASVAIKVTPTIMLLMGMAVTITGHILKQRWLVIFGIVAGLGTFLWEQFGIGETLLFYLIGLSPAQFGITSSTLPCLTVFLFALIGLTLPGLMLKRQK